MQKLTQGIAAMMTAGALLITAAAPAVAQDKPVKVTMIIYASAGVPFFAPLEKGAQDAAKDHKVTLDIQYAQNNVERQNNLLQTALANKVDGIALEIWDDNGFNKPVCETVKKGTPVIGFNIDHSKGGTSENPNCRVAFVGQNFVEAGYAIGKRMVKEHGIKRGDNVFTPVEFPEAAYAILRHKGVQKALDEVGAKADLVGVGDNLPNVLTALTQYLIGHPDTKAIIGLGQQPMMMATKALDNVKMSKVPVGGFDVSPEILKGVESGRITATVDQQPYSQGYYSIAQLAMNIRWGLHPSDMNTGGDGLIDKSNYKRAIEFAGKTR